MNIKQALKKKNRLAGQLKEALQIAVEVNSVVAGTKPSYNSQQKWSEAKSIMSDLVALKAKIHCANAPVADLIFKASEIKSMISILKGMSCSDGPIVSYRATEPIMYVATIGQIDRDKMVSVLETELDTINDRLDEFNAVTKIED
jgi:hypothetical protein